MPIARDSFWLSPQPGQDADPGVGVGEARLAGRDQHVAGQRQLEAAGDGEAVDGADDGQRARRQRIDDARALPADGGADLVRRSTDSPPSSFRSSPAQKARPLPVRITTSTSPACDSSANAARRAATQLARERVQRLRAVERQRGDAIGTVDEEHGIGHARGRSTARAATRRQPRTGGPT